MSNNYSILGVDKNASKAEIRNAYNKLIKIYYPDKNTGNSEKFEQIVKAYREISSCKAKPQVEETIPNFITLKNNFQKDVKVINCNFTGALESIKIDPLNKDDFKTKVQDYELIRSQDDIENTHTNIFANSTFNNIKFNEVFDKYNPKDNAQKSIINYEDLGSAYNDNSFYGFDNYISDPISNNSELDSYYGNIIELPPHL